MTDLRSVQLWEAVAADLRRHRLRGLASVMTEDVLRFTTAQALADRGADPDTLRVERPHPAPPGRRIGLTVGGTPPTGLVQFKFPATRKDRARCGRSPSARFWPTSTGWRCIRVT